MVQMFYFNQEWDSNWGGCLRILKDDNADSVFQEIPPLLNTSVILVRSDNSWHTVTPVSPEAACPTYPQGCLYKERGVSCTKRQ